MFAMAVASGVKWQGCRGPCDGPRIVASMGLEWTATAEPIAEPWRAKR